MEAAQHQKIVSGRGFMKKKRIAGKLRSQAGESIAETLAALLIASAALLMLAGAIASTARIVEGSREKMAAYYEKDENVASHQTPSGTITVNLTEETEDFSEVLGPFSYAGNYYMNDEFGRAAVVSYSAEH